MNRCWGAGLIWVVGAPDFRDVGDSQAIQGDGERLLLSELRHV